MLVRKGPEVGSAVRCFASAVRVHVQSIFVMRARASASANAAGLVLLRRQRLSRKKTFRVGVCGSYGIIKSRLACMLFVHSLQLV